MKGWLTMGKPKVAVKTKEAMRAHVTAELTRVLNTTCTEQYHWLRRAGWSEQDIRIMECDALQVLMMDRQAQKGA